MVHPAISSINLTAALGSLATIARQRPMFMAEVIQAYETLHGKRGGGGKGGGGAGRRTSPWSTPLGVVVVVSAGVGVWVSSIGVGVRVSP